MDDDGKPITNNIPVSFNSIVNHAGVSRGSARPALDICQTQHFITCIQSPEQKRSGSSGTVGEYRIVWNDKYTDPFAGFYAGDGRRTPIPHAFFTEVIPNESLAVIRVVAAVIRNTAGYTANQFGGRRKQATLSYSMLQSYTNLSRESLAVAFKLAIKKGFIIVHERGVFDSNQNKQRTSTYGLKWQQDATKTVIGSKTLPENRTVQKPDQRKAERFKNLTSNGSKTRPEERFKNLTTKKETIKENNKQQHAVAEFDHSVEALTKIGFDEKSARELSTIRSEQEIADQINWMPMRNVRSNALGLLRTAIKENWVKPKVNIRRTPTAERMPMRQNEENDAEAMRQQRMQLRQARLNDWLKLSPNIREQYHSKAVEQARTITEQRRLQQANLENPPNATLAVMVKYFADSR